MARTSTLLGTSLLLGAALLAACSTHEPSSFEGPADGVADGSPLLSAPEAPSEATATPEAEDRETDATTATRSAPPAEGREGIDRNLQVRTELAEGDDDVFDMGGESAAAEQILIPASPVVAGRALPRKKAEEKSKDRRYSSRPAGPATATGGAVGAIDALASGSGAMAPARMDPASQPSGTAVPVPVDSEPITMFGTSETYTDHGVNPFTMVADDALSTFSIDVDTASYSIARKKLEAGVLPPPSAVRVEEFINYLDYDYTPPRASSDTPFTVHMAAMPDPFRDGRHILRVGVQAQEVSRDEREPVHLTFLVDVSGSMSSSDKLPLAKQSLHMLVDSLREDDTVALATYAGRVAKILEPTSAANKRAIHDAIEGLNSGGSTAMSSGIDLAYGMAWESFQDGHENRVIVMSDGDANVGRTSWDDMLSQVKGYADRGVTLSTIGFGMGNYQDTLMEQLSNNGDGNNYYIDDGDQAQRVFVDDLGGTMVTVARDVKIQVEFHDDSVKAYRLLGYENRDIADKDFRNDKVDAGEIGAGHNVTALYEVILADGFDRSLATVRLRYEEPGADVDQGGSGGIEKAFTFRDRDLAERWDLAPRTLRMAYATATFAEVLRHSPEVEELSMDGLIAFAKRAQRSGEDDDAEVVRLMEKARALGAGTSSGAVSAR